MVLVFSFLHCNFSSQKDLCVFDLIKVTISSKWSQTQYCLSISPAASQVPSHSLYLFLMIDFAFPVYALETFIPVPFKLHILFQLILGLAFFIPFARKGQRSAF